MNGYQFCAPFPPTAPISTVQIVGTNTFIPLNQANSDCVRFLSDWKAGAEVTDAGNNPAPYSDEAVVALGLTPPT